MRSLERLLRPKSVAVIGGGTWCENVVRECRKSGFRGELRVVHPKRSEVGGCMAVKSIDELPFAPDATFIGVNRHLTVDIVRRLSAIRAGGAVCFASGFREAAQELDDGHSLQEELVLAAGDMPILGPNCYGFINALDGAMLWPDQHGAEVVSRGIAIISQSSNIALNMTMQTRGLPIAYLLTVGNQAQTGLSDIGEALLDDDRVTAIGLHIEGIGDLRGFEQFARKANALGKPLVALKVGKSEQAKTATVSHTASLAGGMAGASALFRRLGIAQVDSLPVLLETLKLVHVAGYLPNARIASMSCSGGEASLMADTAFQKGVFFPELDDQQKTHLKRVLGHKVALANPLDYHTYIWGDVDEMSRTFTAMMQGDLSLGIVVLDFPRADRCSQDEWVKVLEAIEIAVKATGKPMAVLSSLTETLPEDVAVSLMAKGIVPFCGMEEAMSAIAAVSSIPEELTSETIHIPKTVGNSITISEGKAKIALQKHGARIPVSVQAKGAFEAVSVAEDVGFPVVLKGLGIAHKTEAGAVSLNLMSAEEVSDAASAMPADRFLVEEMVTGGIAELLVGVLRDPAHGLILTLAAGGVLTELLQDSVSLILPVSRSEVSDALSKLRVFEILSGYRGGPQCDLDAINDAVMAVQSYAMSTAVEEIEINPLLCGRDFAIAVDALIKCGEAIDE
ncbi:acetate--CoA ligase family protein [Roseibium sp. SCP14]|uniref:acetate--CoA ligase family protein n=1 Tax=Roseibium sp. SCP14 TaxID=3141375 RepID=UPI00333B1A7F